jgi:hypothetical protein
MKQNPERSKVIKEDQREAFRVDDSLSVMLCQVEDHESPSTWESELEDLKGLSPSALQGENSIPYLWKMLCNINKKLDWILEKLPVDLARIKTRAVNLSSSGMRITDRKNFQVAQEIRIKILLPTFPAREVLIPGKVVRVRDLKKGEYEVALHFQNLDEGVKSEIIQYILKRQRMVISAQRDQRKKEGEPHETTGL